jgi:hypothetical protein
MRKISFLIIEQQHSLILNQNNSISVSENILNIFLYVKEERRMEKHVDVEFCLILSTTAADQ